MLYKISQEKTDATKSIVNSVLGIPPVDLRAETRNKVEAIFDDKLDLVSQVFPNGNEF